MKYDLDPIDETINDNREGSEVGEIIKKLRNTAFSLHTKEELTIYVQNHQKDLLKKKEALVYDAKCDKILFFLETYFEEYLNRNLPISELGKQSITLQTSNTIEIFKTSISDRISPRLLLLIDQLLNAENVTTTIHNCFYIREFWDCWNTDFNKFYEELNEVRFVQFLISQNFNSPHFFTFLTNQITSDLNNEDDPIHQRIVLESYQKKYNIVLPCLTKEYKIGFPSIVDLVSNWINREIKYCKKRQKLFNPAQTTLISKEINSIQKIETSLSVPQLACLFKMLSKSGIITNPVKTEMLEVVSKAFKTKKTEVIALESLHNKFYNTEDKTRETVKQLLKQVVLENS